MIPNLHELPPLTEEEHPFRKLLRPLLGGLFMLSLLGGLLWLYTTAIRQGANQEVNVMGGLRSVAQDIWTTGTAPEVRVPDPDLITEMARLRGKVTTGTEILVLPAENRLGQPRATHELAYLSKGRMIITIRIFLDETGGSLICCPTRQAWNLRMPPSCPDSGAAGEPGGTGEVGGKTTGKNT